MELELLQRPEMKKKIYNLPLEYDFYHIWHDQQCKYTGKPWNNHSFSARLPQPQWGLEGVDLERCLIVFDCGCITICMYVCMYILAFLCVREWMYIRIFSNLV